MAQPLPTVVMAVALVPGLPAGGEGAAVAGGSQPIATSEPEGERAFATPEDQPFPYEALLAPTLEVLDQRIPLVEQSPAKRYA